MVYESYDEALNGSSGSRKWSAGRVIANRLPGIDVGANLGTDVKSGRGEVSLITMAANTASRFTQTLFGTIADWQKVTVTGICEVYKLICCNRELFLFLRHQCERHRRSGPSTDQPTFDVL
jgi:hypothetical protein